MYKPIRAVALRTVKYNDRSSILTAYAAEAGRVSFLMPSGTGVESRRRRALTMPLSLFEAVADVRPGRDIHTLRDLRPMSGIALDPASNPVRATVAMFIAEVLGVVTREGDADAALWALIVDTATSLSTASGRTLSNFPHAFLVRLADVVGIAPDVSEYRRHSWLDMLEGVYRHTPPLHDYRLEPADARLAAVFASTVVSSYDHAGLAAMGATVRAKLLDGLIGYFTLHHYRLDCLHSLDILRMLGR